ncbi:MAG: hypothetical protein NTY09_13750 [bacterium]|nr:hypothetical protein [bacterium]
MRVNYYGKIDANDIIGGLENELRDYPERHWGNSTYSNLKPDRKLYWEEFLRICHERSIKVYAYMTPLTPELLERIYQIEGFDADALYTEVRTYLEETISENGGVFRDYTEVSSFDGDPEDFIDAVHVGSKNGEIILRHLLDDDFGQETGVNNGDVNENDSDTDPVF